MAIASVSPPLKRTVVTTVVRKNELFGYQHSLRVLRWSWGVGLAPLPPEDSQPPYIPFQTSLPISSPSPSLGPPRPTPRACSPPTPPVGSHAGASWSPALTPLCCLPPSVTWEVWNNHDYKPQPLLRPLGTLLTQISLLSTTLGSSGSKLFSRSLSPRYFAVTGVQWLSSPQRRTVRHP